MVPPTVCSTSYFSFNLIKKTPQVCPEAPFLGTSRSYRALLTEPSASLPLLISEVSVLLGSCPSSDFSVSSTALPTVYFPLHGDQLLFLALALFLPSYPNKGILDHSKVQPPLLRSLNWTISQSLEVHLRYLQGLSQHRWPR